MTLMQLLKVIFFSLAVLCLPYTATPVIGQYCAAEASYFGLVWSPDNITLAIITSQDTYLLDTENLNEPPRSFATTSWLRFDPLGQRLLTDHQLLNARSLEVMIDFDSIGYRTFNDDGRYIIQWEMPAGLWDTVTNQIILEADFLNFSPIERFVYEKTNVYDEHFIRLWNMQNLSNAPLVLSNGLYRGRQFVLFNPNETVIAISDLSSRFVQTWDTYSGNHIADLEHAYGHAVPLAFSPDGNYLVTASYLPSGIAVGDSGNYTYDAQREVKVWDGNTSQLVQQWDNARFVGFSPDGTLFIFKQLIDNGESEAIRAWEVVNNQIHHLAEIMSTSVTTYNSYGLNGAFVVWDENRLIAIADTSVFLWDAETLLPATTPQIITVSTPVAYADLNATNNRLLTYHIDSEDSTQIYASVWDVETNRQIFSVLANDNLAFSPNGSILRYSTNNNEIHWLDAFTGEELHIVSHFDDVQYAADWLRTAYLEDDTVYLFDLMTGLETALLRLHDAECD